MALVELLAGAGCVAPKEEAAELRSAAGDDPGRLEAMLERRCSGEPLAWITGSVDFCGRRITLRPGVYVPRWQTQQLVLRAAEALPESGVAADLCTGSGAVAVALHGLRPRARIVATEIEPRAAGCARANGVEVRTGHLGDPLLPELAGRFDLVTAVPPYVPTGELRFLPRDVRDWEPTRALDGGSDGLALVGELVPAAALLLRPGGTLALEIGGPQEVAVGALLSRSGFGSIEPVEDHDGDLRGITALRG